MTQATQNTKQIKIDINISSDEDVLSIGENPADTNLRNKLRIKPVFHEDGHVESVTVKDVQGFKGSVPMDEWEGLAWGIELPHYTNLDELRKLVEGDEFQERLRSACSDWRNHDEELITQDEKEKLQVENVIEAYDLAHDDFCGIVREVAAGTVDDYNIEDYVTDRSAIGAKDEDRAWAAIFGKDGEHVKRVTEIYAGYVEGSDYFVLGDMEEAMQDVFNYASSSW